MRDKGFMLVDSLLTMVIFGIIISVLMPAVMMLEQTMAESEESLEFNRRLYLEILSHEDFEAFKRRTSSYIIHDDRICSIKAEKQCTHFE